MDCPHEETFTDTNYGLGCQWNRIQLTGLILEFQKAWYVVRQENMLWSNRNLVFTGGWIPPLLTIVAFLQKLPQKCVNHQTLSNNWNPCDLSLCISAILRNFTAQHKPLSNKRTNIQSLKYLNNSPSNSAQQDSRTISWSLIRIIKCYVLSFILWHYGGKTMTACKNLLLCRSDLAMQIKRLQVAHTHASTPTNTNSLLYFYLWENFHKHNTLPSSLPYSSQLSP